MLKHYNEKELEKMTKVPNTESCSKTELPKTESSKKANKDRPNDVPMTRSRTKEIMLIHRQMVHE